jgi:hypothetical protein
MKTENAIEERNKLIAEMYQFMRREFSETMANLILYLGGIWDLEPKELKRWQELGFLKGNERHLYLQDQQMYNYMQSQDHDDHSNAMLLSLLAMQFYNIIEYR